VADLRENLRRDLDRVTPSSDGYEETLARVGGRRRRRRIGAAALGVGLTLLLVGAAVVVVQDRHGRPAGNPSPMPTDLGSPVPIVTSANGPLAYTDGRDQSLVVTGADGQEIQRVRFPGPGMPWHVAWSPDGTAVAVVVFDGQRSLWVLHADAPPTELASGSNVFEPSWSPDGAWIAYSIDRATTSEIHVVRPDGTDDTIVRSVPRSPLFAIFSAKFSPDGTRILFDEGTDSEFDISVMDADGSNVRRLTHTGVDYDPSWSPDGRQIVFTRQDVAESDIFLMNADGSDVRRLTTAGPNEANLNPAFSPDGRSIAYMQTDPQAKRLVQIALDGSNPVVLVDGEVLSFSWAPAGTPTDRTFTPPTLEAPTRQEIAHGEIEGQPWSLWLTDDGLGLEFRGPDGGGGGAGSELGNEVFGGAGSSGPSWSADEGWSTMPREIEGVVTTRAAKVEYHLVEGDVVPATLYPLPADAFGGGAQAYLVFVSNDVLIQAGDLVAYDEQGNELGRQYLDFSPVSLFPKVLQESSPEAVAAMEDLRLAGAVAGRYFHTHGSWTGFDPTTASEISDAISYNTSPTAVVGEVSIRVSGKRDLVLATKIPNGDVYSACLQNGPDTAIDGRNDVSDPSTCSNGWLEAP
jgi:lipoprotein LpqB-like beta-propeller protein